MTTPDNAPRMTFQLTGKRTAAWVAAIVAGAFLASSTVHAQPTEPQTEQEAQALLEAAVELMEAKQFSRACRQLEAVVRKLPRATGARLELARCYKGEGRLASAWNQFVKVEIAARIVGHKERIAEANKNVAELALIMPKLQLVVPPDAAAIPGMTIALNGQPQDPQVWGTPLPVDAMEYEIKATAPGRQPWTTRVQLTDEKKGTSNPPVVVNVGVPPLPQTMLKMGAVADLAGIHGLIVKVDGAPIDLQEWVIGKQVEGKVHRVEVSAPGYERWVKQVEVPFGETVVLTLEPLRKLPPVGPEIPAPARVLPPSSSPPSAFNGRTVGIVGIAMGSIGLGAGSVLGTLALVKNAESDDGHCDASSACNAYGFELRKTAITLGNASTATLLVGGILLAGGVTMVALSPSPKTGGDHRGRTAEASVWIGPGGVGIRGRW